MAKEESGLPVESSEPTTLRFGLAAGAADVTFQTGWWWCLHPGGDGFRYGGVTVSL